VRAVPGGPAVCAAAAFGVVVAVAALAMFLQTLDTVTVPSPAPPPESLADLMTARSWNAAFRRGGYDELDRLCYQAGKLAGPRPDSLSTRDALEDFDD
jgi:hypothetical protein